MKRLFLTGVAALSVLSASAAYAREWQGNMPKPAGKLPPYPPIVCVTPNWTPEPCENRQPPNGFQALYEFFKWLEWTKTNWLGTILVDYKPWNGTWPKHSSDATDSSTATFYGTGQGIVVLRNQIGGLYQVHQQLFQAMKENGSYVEVEGRCLSGCTLVLSYIPKSHLCFHETALLGFHLGSDPTTKLPLIEGSRIMLSNYPQDIRLWLREKGGVEKMPYGSEFWTMSASELWEMGYSKCKTGPFPHALDNYRPVWK